MLGNFSIPRYFYFYKNFCESRNGVSNFPFKINAINCIFWVPILSGILESHASSLRFLEKYFFIIELYTSIMTKVVQKIYSGFFISASLDLRKPGRSLHLRSMRQIRKTYSLFKSWVYCHLHHTSCWNFSSYE